MLALAGAVRLGVAGMSTSMHQRDIFHLQDQNHKIVQQIETVEHERDLANEQIQACEAKDATFQNEVQGVRDRISILSSRLNQDRTETGAKDEHIKVLGEQNTQMLALLDAEENKCKTWLAKIAELEKRNKKLQAISEIFDVTKAELEKQVAEAKGRCAEIVAVVRGVRSINENLRANIQNTEATTRVDIETLGQGLQVVESKNLEYLNRVNKQEAREKQLQAETNSMKDEVERVRAEIDELRKKLEGDDESRAAFERARSQVETAIEALEIQADTLKKALGTSERANEQLQDENKSAAERCRETADKVYALMDSLRLNQVELKKLEAENQVKDKKIVSLDRQTQNLQAKISMECDAKVLAEQERKEAEQEAVVLKKKNRVIEEGVTQAQVSQERSEKEILEVCEVVASQQTQNAYLASRIDSQEEEKNTLKAEVAKVTKHSGELVADNTKLRDEIDRLEEQAATTQHDLLTYKQELEYVKREDALDDAGRQRPVLIQSTDSDLLDKLQINEFLYEAQQARNPVPPLIEKVAQLLAMLHEGQGRADQYLGDLSKSNSLVSALRQRNMALYSRSQMFESFKTRALLRYVMNLIEGEGATNLYLDSLSFGVREINELLHLIPRYEKTERIFVVSLIDNGLDDENASLLIQLLYQLPYLRRLDLKRNAFTANGARKFEEQLRMMEGVTSVIRTADGVLNVHSGNQLRCAVDLSEQQTKDKIAKEPDWEVDEKLAHKDADAFLATNGGASLHPWTKTAAAAHKPTGQAIPDVGAKAIMGKVDSKKAKSQEPEEESGHGDYDKTHVPRRAHGSGSGESGYEIGGPPVGLGGPGNVAALNKRSQGAKAGLKKMPEAGKRQAKRAKEGPPPALDYEPDHRVVDKWQSGCTLPAAPSSGRRSSASLRSGGCEVIYPGSCSPSPVRSLSADRPLDRSHSTPALPPSYGSGAGRKAPPPPLASLAQRHQRPPRH